MSMLLKHIFILAASLLLPLDGYTQSKTNKLENGMDQSFTISGSRIGPPKMKPIKFDGKRYEQIDNGEFVGLQQRTGLMAIYDDASNKRIAIVSIYEEKREGMYEPALQDIFFIRFELDEKKRELHIENERHKHFIYSIDDGVVRASQ